MFLPKGEDGIDFSQEFLILCEQQDEEQCKNIVFHFHNNILYAPSARAVS